MKNIAAIILLFTVVLMGCRQKPLQPVPNADSAATTNAVRELHGKPMRTFHGPAEILGDTTKNQRHPAPF